MYTDGDAAEHVADDNKGTQFTHKYGCRSSQEGIRATPMDPRAHFFPSLKAGCSQLNDNVEQKENGHPDHVVRTHKERIEILRAASLQIGEGADRKARKGSITRKQVGPARAVRRKQTFTLG